MSDRNVKNRQTALTQYVQDKWRDRHCSQAQFVEHLLGAEAAEEFGKQTLSKFIHGRLAEPPPQLIPALARTYGEHSIQVLEEMHKQERRPLEARATPAGEDVPISFLVGHTVWAATFIAAMLDPREGPQHVRFASFAKPDADGESPGDPIWVESRSQPPDSVPGPGSGLVPLAAPDVIRLMQEDLDQEGVVFGLLPGQLLAERQREQKDNDDDDGSFVRLATLVDAAAACVLIVPSEGSDALGPDPVSSAEVASWLVDTTAQGSRAVILAETGTVAAERARRISSMAKARAFAKAKAGGRLSGDFTSNNLPTRELRRLTWEELTQRQPDVQAIVAWEPQATWFDKSSSKSSKPGVKRVPLLDVPEAGKPAQQLTFDIHLFVPAVQKADPSWRASAARAVRRLLREILPMIQSKQVSVPQLYSKSSGSDLENLSAYFGFDALLSSQQIEDILASIHFATSADPRGMKPWLSFWLKEPSLGR